jgi:hypothetical protein
VEKLKDVVGMMAEKAFTTCTPLLTPQPRKGFNEANVRINMGGNGSKLSYSIFKTLICTCGHLGTGRNLVKPEDGLSRLGFEPYKLRLHHSFC